MSGTSPSPHLNLGWCKTALVWLTLFPLAVMAQGVLEVYETYHQAKKIAKYVAPLLKEGDKIQSLGNKLIVRTDDGTHEQILKLLEEIDRPPKNFLVSFRVSDQAKTRHEDLDLKFETRNSHEPVRLQKSPLENDEVIVYRGSSTDGHISMSVRAADRRSTRQTNILQQVRVMEGEHAYVATGESFPVQALVPTEQGTQANTTYKSLTSGFHIKPIWTKDGIIVEISEQIEKRNQQLNKIITTYQTITTLRVPVSRWTPISGTSQQQNDHQGSIAFSTAGKHRQRQGLEIRVDLIE